MKKVLLLLLFMFVMFPVTVFGSIFDIPKTNITIDIDEDTWTVFTIEDVENEEIMESYGMDYNQMKNFFETNNVYLDAYANLDGENITELIIGKDKNENNINNLFELDDTAISDFAESFAADNNIENYDIYTSDDNVYIYYTFFQNEHYGAQYYTIVNGDNYYINFHSETDLNEELISSFDSVIDGITFNYKQSETVKPSKNSKAVRNIVFGSFGFIILLIMLAKRSNE